MGDEPAPLSPHCGVNAEHYMAMPAAHYLQQSTLPHQSRQVPLEKCDAKTGVNADARMTTGWWATLGAVFDWGRSQPPHTA